MIKRVLLIATIIFILLIVNVKAATLTGNVHFIIRNANGTNLNYKLYNVTGTTGTITLFNGGISTLDNNGGGTWKRVDIFPFSAATLSDGQYCIKINSAWINITNSTGALKASLYDPLFWTYVNSTGADIRLTNQSNELYFWIQDFNATAKTATIWVNLTAGSIELDIYYGNLNASPSTYNNASRTFLFFDDFTKGLVGSWTQVTGTWTDVAGTGLKVSADYGSAPGNVILFTGRNFTAGEYIAYIYGILGSNDVGFIFNAQGTTATSQFDVAGLDKYHEWAYINEWSGTAWGIATTFATTVTTGDKALVKVWQKGTTVYCYTKDFTNNIKTEITRNVTLTSGYIGLHNSVITTTSSIFKLFFIAGLSDPAGFSTPTAENITTVNATASINSESLVAPYLNLTVPSRTFTLPSLAATNWFNFSAEKGNFSANVTFSFTSSFTQTQTANFTELVVSANVYVPQNCTSNTLTVSFNTSDIPAGVEIYSYNLSVIVNGTQVKFSKTATENLSVWYLTITVNDLKQGWHSIKILLVYQPAYIDISVYNANNVTSLLSKTLNVTVYDSNFNVLTSTTVNKTANISVVFAGKVFVRISNAGVARQLETTIAPGDTAHLTFYFPTQNVVLATIQLVDYTNSFSNATVIIKRYITRNEIETVDVQKVSANLQTSHYLIANTPYEVVVTNGHDTRDLGYISVAYSQTITLYIGNILNINAYPYVGVAFSINRTNNSIVITYKTEHGTTSRVDVVITNSTGYTVFNTTLTTQEGRVVYLINNTNETYYVSFHAENTFSPVSYRTVVSSAYTFSPVLPTLAGGATFAVALPSLPGWMRALWFGGLAIFVGLLFRRRFVPIGLTVSLAVLVVFILSNVLKVSTNLIYVLATIVVVAWFAWWRGRG